MAPLGPNEDTPEPHRPGHDTQERIEIAAEKAVRRATGKHETVKQSSWMKLAIGPIAGALVMGCAAILWDGFRAKITEGAAKVEVVTKLDEDNARAHAAIKADLDAVKTEQAKTTAILKRVARKLKVDE